MVILQPASTYRNIFHFTTGLNRDEHGSRTPSMWLMNNQVLLIRFNTDSDHNKGYFSQSVPLNQKLRVIIQQVMVSNQPVFRIFIDQIMVYEFAHNWKIPFKNVKFYMSDPWYTTAPVKILYFNYEQFYSL